MNEENTDKQPNRQATQGRTASACSVDWVILFTSLDGQSDEWESFKGTRDEAVDYATSDRRHLNYGRNGFKLIEHVTYDHDWHWPSTGAGMGYICSKCMDFKPREEGQ